MRLVVLAILLGVTSAARADDACNIRVVKAPNKVRLAIEARAGIESACTALEVRVTKRGNKLVVTARSQDGKTLRGDARDAGRAAELVMRWAAPAEVIATVVEDTPVAPAPASAPTVPLVEATAVEHITDERPARRQDIGAGVLASPIAYGVRGEVDALAWRGLALGFSFGASNAIWKSGDLMTGTTLDVRDISAGAYAALTLGTGAWRLRMQAGAGVIYTQYAAKARIAPFDRIASGDGVTRMLDATLALSRELSSGWAVQVGPLLQYYAQTFALDATRSPRRDYDLAGYVAIKKRL